VYPRVIEEAALRAIAAAGKDTRLLARTVTLAYRKPCFAGDSVRVALRLYEHEGVIGAACAVIGAKGDGRCFGRIVFGA
jgi:hypothetical protein